MNAVRLAGALLPSCAVLLGLYGLRSAWAAVLLYHAGIVAFAFFLRGKRWPGVRDEAPEILPLAERVRRWLPALSFVCALAGVAFYMLWNWIVRPETSLSVWLAQRGMSGWSWWLFVPYFGLLHPVLEEWHWSRMGEGLPVGPGITDAFFASYHLLVLGTLVRWPWLVLIFAVLLGSSVFWRWTYRYSRTRYVPLLTHGAADLSIVLAASLLLLQGR